jgi:TolB-like protein
MNQLELALLGSFSARSSDGVEIALPMRKAEALLAYVAMSPGEALSRGKLAGLLWGERGEEQARGSLRQVLTALRKSFADAGLAPLHIDRSSVRADPMTVGLDVARFEALAATDSRNSLAEAAGLYRGDFLAGFDSGDAAFDDWAAWQRNRLQVLAADVLSRLMALQKAQGEFSHAIASAQRLLALDPLTEATHRSLMALYVASGRPGLAVAQYRDCETLLARELSIKPSRETEELYRKARRSDGAVQIGGGNIARPLEVTAPRASGRASEKPSVVVLPLANLGGDPEETYLSDGITEDIITDLARYSSLFIIARDSSFAFRDKPASISETAGRLGVTYAVVGSLQRRCDWLRINIQLVEAATGRQLWSEHYVRDAGDIGAVQDEIVETVVTTLAGRIGEIGARQSTRKTTENLTAFDYVLQARQLIHRFNADDNRAAVDLLGKAIAIDPGYAAAHAWLSEARWCDWTGGWTASDRACFDEYVASAERAYALDDRDLMAQLTISQAHLYRRNFDQAGHHVERARLLNPYDTDLAVSRAFHLIYTGAAAGAVETIEAAQRRDPFGHFGMVLGVALYSARRYREAATALKTVRARFSLVQAWLAASEARAGNAEAVRAAAKRFAETLREDRTACGAPAEDDPVEFVMRRTPYAGEEDARHLLDGLALAGLFTEPA